MIAKYNDHGLIIAGCPQSASVLDELMTYCGWPIVFQATPRQLRDEIVSNVPQALLFWLDRERDFDAMFRLLKWLAAYQPRLQRYAVGYELPENMEVAVRNAGAHVYLAAANDIRELLAGPIFQSLLGEGHYAHKAAKRSAVSNSPEAVLECRGVALHNGLPP
jgi:hypothetical protein